MTSSKSDVIGSVKFLLDVTILKRSRPESEVLLRLEMTGTLSRDRGLEAPESLMIEAITNSRRNRSSAIDSRARLLKGLPEASSRLPEVHLAPSH